MLLPLVLLLSHLTAPFPGQYPAGQAPAAAPLLLIFCCPAHPSSVVACCCAEYWTRYARHLEASGDIERARAAVQRAALVHCKQQHTAHLYAALFEERHGNADAARASFILVQVETMRDLAW